jgi:branched-chain amino acid aminotransferase
MGYRDGFVLLDGRIVAAATAKVSVFDRGLLYGDGLFETMRAYGGKVFALEAHLQRLRASAQFLGLPLPDLDWRDSLEELLRRNRLADRDAWVRLNVTRGAAEPGLLPPAEPRPTCFILVLPVAPSIATVQRRGVAVTLLPYARRGFVPEHKSFNYLSGVIGKILADHRGAYEGLFVRDGKFLTEGTTSSVFVVRNGHLLTPSEEGILPGVTRRLVLEAADSAGIPNAQRALRTSALTSADEAFLTSSVAEIVPVVRVDGHPIGSAKPGPLTRRLQRLYKTYVRLSLRGA